jgi:hypothetical protein
MLQLGIILRPEHAFKVKSPKCSPAPSEHMHTMPAIWFHMFGGIQPSPSSHAKHFEAPTGILFFNWETGCLLF